MADDWGKWQKEWTRLEPKLRVYSLAQGRKLAAVVTARDKLVDQHEKAFRAAIQGAIKAGVKGDTLKELSAHKPVVAAQSALDDDCREVGAEVKALSTFCKECEEIARTVEKLSEEIAKGLKASGGKAPGAHAKWVDKVETTRKELHEAATFRFKIDKFLAAFPKQYPEWLKHVVEKELEKGSGEAEKQREKEAEKLGIDADSFDEIRGKADALRRKMEKALSSAKDNYKENPREASDFLKVALTELTAIRKLILDAKDHFISHKKAIAALKDGKKIAKMVEGMQEFLTEAQADYKKAGEDFKRAQAKT